MSLFNVTRPAHLVLGKQPAGSSLRKNKLFSHQLFAACSFSSTGVTLESSLIYVVMSTARIVQTFSLGIHLVAV